MPGTSTIQGKGTTRLLQLTAGLAAAFVVCIYLTHGIGRSMWLDEANTVIIASGSPKQILDSLSRDTLARTAVLILCSLDGCGCLVTPKLRFDSHRFCFILLEFASCGSWAGCCSVLKVPE